MASVHKQPGRPYYFGAFTNSEGKRVFRSTKSRNKEQAEAICRQWQKAARIGKSGKLNPDEVRSILSTGLRDIFIEANKEPMPNDTIRAFAKEWLEGKKLELEPTSYDRYEGVIDRFLSFLGEKADKDLAIITASDLSRFRDAQAKELSSSSSQLSLKVLRVFFGAAYREERVSKNIASIVPTLKDRKAGTRRGFTIGEIQSLLKKCKGTEWEGMILFGLYTAQRLGDLARLTWRSINMDDLTLTLITRKTGRPMILPIAVPLLKYIQKLQSTDDLDASLFPKCFKLSQKSSSKLSSQFFDLMADANLVAARPTRHVKSTGQGRNAARPVSPISFHSLRHSTTTFLKAAGISDVMAREIVGHESEIISRNYTHLDVEDLRKAMTKLFDVTA